jgi:hypothetical protein
LADLDDEVLLARVVEEGLRRPSWDLGGLLRALGGLLGLRYRSTDKPYDRAEL